MDIYNPAFLDVTPADLVTAIITEKRRSSSALYKINCKRGNELNSRVAVGPAGPPVEPNMKNIRHKIFNVLCILSLAKFICVALLCQRTNYDCDYVHYWSHSDTVYSVGTRPNIITLSTSSRDIPTKHRQICSTSHRCFHPPRRLELHGSSLG